MRRSFHSTRAPTADRRPTTDEYDTALPTKETCFFLPHPSSPHLFWPIFFRPVSLFSPPRTEESVSRRLSGFPPSSLVPVNPASPFRPSPLNIVEAAACIVHVLMDTSYTPPTYRDDGVGDTATVIGHIFNPIFIFHFYFHSVNDPWCLPVHLPLALPSGDQRAATSRQAGRLAGWMGGWLCENFTPKKTASRVGWCGPSERLMIFAGVRGGDVARVG